MATRSTARKTSRKKKPSPGRSRSTPPVASKERHTPRSGKVLQLSPPTSKKVLAAAWSGPNRCSTRLSAVVAVEEVVGQEGDNRAVTAWAAGPARRSQAGILAGLKGVTALKRAFRAQEVADLLAAIASVHRLGLLLKLLEGPATYQALVKATGLKPGPLYHHLTQLRLAGLIGPRQRDLYSLTRGGRNLILVASTLPQLANDRRPRPAWTEPS